MKSVADKPTIVILFTSNSSLARDAGTEHVFVDMANEFSARGYKVLAITNDEQTVIPFYKLDAGVHFIGTGIINFKIPILIKTKREINRIIDFCEYPQHTYRANLVADKLRPLLSKLAVKAIICYNHESVLVANRLHLEKVPILSMQHNAIKVTLGHMNKYALQEENKVAITQVLMPGYVSDAKKFVRTQVVYIPNTVQPVAPQNYAHPGLEKPIKTIITVGRLTPGQKQTDILVKAFALLASRYPDWQVKLYGKADEVEKKFEAVLQKFIQERHLNQQIILCGTTKRIQEQLREADIFAFPSAYEGFPLALTEAMAVGLPAVGFKEAEAVKDLIKDGETGILCDAGINNFAAGLEKLMQDAELRTRLGQRAREAMAVFKPEQIWNQWEDLLNNL